MKEIYNIFEEKNIQKKLGGSNRDRKLQKITIDYREKNCFVPTFLKKEGFEIEFRELKVADYIVKGVAIERKTISDFISSMINHRLVKQLEEMQQYENKFLIVEGVEEQELYNDDNPKINANAIRSFLLSIILKHKVPIIFTKNQRDTAKFLAILYQKESKETSLNVRKKSLNKKEQKQFLIEGFPGIGPKNAKKLLEQFGTIKNIINSSSEELKKVLGKKADIFRIVDEKY